MTCRYCRELHSPYNHLDVERDHWKRPSATSRRKWSQVPNDFVNTTCDKEQFANKMKIISQHEAGEWCCSHGIPLNHFGLPAVRSIADASDFPIPQDAGQRIGLVKDQMEKLVMDNSCLVWLDDWSVWPSGQWHHLFERFRLSYGCQDHLIDKPAHLIEKSEFDAAISIVVYAILMLWDCYVISDRGAWVHYSHDEFGRKQNEAITE